MFESRLADIAPSHLLAVRCAAEASDEEQVRALRDDAVNKADRQVTAAYATATATHTATATAIAMHTDASSDSSSRFSLIGSCSSSSSFAGITPQFLRGEELNRGCLQISLGHRSNGHLHELTPAQDVSQIEFPGGSLAPEGPRLDCGLLVRNTHAGLGWDNEHSTASQIIYDR